MDRRLSRPLVPFVLLVAVVAGPVGSTDASSGKTVVLKNVRFTPKKLTVSRGAKVTFLWHDGITRHNVTSVGARHFKSATSRSTGTYSVRLKKAGTYRYECTLHPGMTGRIRVR
jgi:plastocyanin